MGLSKEGGTKGGAVMAATSIIFMFFFVLSYDPSIVLLSAFQCIQDILASLLDSGRTKGHVVHLYLCQ